LTSTRDQSAELAEPRRECERLRSLAPARDVGSAVAIGVRGKCGGSVGADPDDPVQQGASVRSGRAELVQVDQLVARDERTPLAHDDRCESMREPLGVPRDVGDRDVGAGLDDELDRPQRRRARRLVAAKAVGDAFGVQDSVASGARLVLVANEVPVSILGSGQLPAEDSAAPWGDGSRAGVGPEPERRAIGAMDSPVVHVSGRVVDAHDLLEPLPGAVIEAGVVADESIVAPLERVARRGIVVVAGRAEAGHASDRSELQIPAATDPRRATAAVVGELYGGLEVARSRGHDQGDHGARGPGEELGLVGLPRGFDPGPEALTRGRVVHRAPRERQRSSREHRGAGP
jgi:hypothetical protein